MRAIERRTSGGAAPLPAIELCDLQGTGITAKCYSDIDFAKLAAPGLYESIRALPFHSLVILFREARDFGHYTALIARNDGKLEYFDSTGRQPDRLRRGMPPALLATLGQRLPLLHAVLEREAERGRPVVYNEHRLQPDGSSNTCGFWVLIRIISALRTGVDEEEFASAWDNEARRLEMSPDELLTRLVRGGAL